MAQNCVKGQSKLLRYEGSKFRFCYFTLGWPFGSKSQKLWKAGRYPESWMKIRYDLADWLNLGLGRNWGLLTGDLKDILKVYGKKIRNTIFSFLKTDIFIYMLTSSSRRVLVFGIWEAHTPVPKQLRTWLAERVWTVLAATRGDQPKWVTPNGSFKGWGSPNFPALSLYIFSKWDKADETIKKILWG